MHVALKLPAKEVSGPVGFQVTGTFDQPRVRLDPASILKQPGVDKALEQGRELLRDLFGR